MKYGPKWSEAQKAEREFWEGIAAREEDIFRVLADNEQKALFFRDLIRSRPQKCLEVGIGPLGIGILGFLIDVPFKIGLDPLPRFELRCGKSLCDYVQVVRNPVYYVVGSGENIPIADECIDLVICSNTLDHVLDPEAVLGEIRRVLTSGGLFLLEVDAFSVCGLLKWYGWTKHMYKDQILVKAHPHRLTERKISSILSANGFDIENRWGHGRLSAVFGRSRSSIFLVKRR